MDPNVKAILDAMAEQAHSTPVKVPLQPWQIPSAPWERIHIDFASPLNGFSFLIIVDAYSKWPEIFEMQNTTLQLTTDRLDAGKIKKQLSQTTVRNSFRNISRAFA